MDSQRPEGATEAPPVHVFKPHELDRMRGLTYDHVWMKERVRHSDLCDQCVRKMHVGLDDVASDLQAPEDDEILQASFDGQLSLKTRQYPDKMRSMAELDDLKEKADVTWRSEAVLDPWKGALRSYGRNIMANDGRPSKLYDMNLWHALGSRYEDRFLLLPGSGEAPMTDFVDTLVCWLEQQAISSLDSDGWIKQCDCPTTWDMRPVIGILWERLGPRIRRTLTPIINSRKVRFTNRDGLNEFKVFWSSPVVRQHIERLKSQMRSERAQSFSGYQSSS